MAENTPACLTKDVTVIYGPRLLKGTLHHIGIEEFMHHHSRFFGIDPSVSPPALDSEDCRPYTLMHSILGKTWVHAGQLRLPLDLQGILTDGARRPTFIAMTDNADLFYRGQTLLGECNANGDFTARDPDTANDLIVALSCKKQLVGVRNHSPSKHMKSMPVVDYPSYPTSAEVLHLVEKIKTAANHPAFTVMGRAIPKKDWVRDNLEVDHKGVVMKSSPLYPHRGNEALLSRRIWKRLFLDKDGSGKITHADVEALPDAYFRPLYEDLSLRPVVDYVPADGYDLEEPEWLTQAKDAEMFHRTGVFDMRKHMEEVVAAEWDRIVMREEPKEKQEPPEGHKDMAMSG